MLNGSRESEGIDGVDYFMYSVSYYYTVDLLWKGHQTLSAWYY